MKHLSKIHTLVVFALAVGVAAFWIVTPSRAKDRRAANATTERAAPGGVNRIVSATPFVLERPWVHVWRSEAPSFRAGWLLVLDVDPRLVEPKQLEEPVLYAGGQTVERVNHGFESGRVVAILPSELDARGDVALDLASVLFYFGAPALPERVDAGRAERELAHARELGVAPLAVPAIGDVLRLSSRDELDPAAGLLVLEHSPAEQDLGVGLLAPRVR